MTHWGINKITGIIDLDLKLRSLSSWKKTLFLPHSSSQRNITLLYAETPTKPNTQIFPCSVLQGLRFHLLGKSLGLRFYWLTFSKPPDRPSSTVSSESSRTMTWLEPPAQRIRLKLVFWDLLARNCFTDISINQLFYTANLNSNVGPH
jgi:hypothetical protein